MSQYSFNNTVKLRLSTIPIIEYFGTKRYYGRIYTVFDNAGYYINYKNGLGIKPDKVNDLYTNPQESATDPFENYFSEISVNNISIAEVATAIGKSGLFIGTEENANNDSKAGLIKDFYDECLSVYNNVLRYAYSSSKYLDYTHTRTRIYTEYDEFGTEIFTETTVRTGNGAGQSEYAKEYKWGSTIGAYYLSSEAKITSEYVVSQDPNSPWDTWFLEEAKDLVTLRNVGDDIPTTKTYNKIVKTYTFNGGVPGGTHSLPLPPAPNPTLPTSDEGTKQYYNDHQFDNTVYKMREIPDYATLIAQYPKPAPWLF
jgi:hypothetical protein